MRIAIASEGSNVSNHFGHCENFNIFDISDNRIKEKISIKNPGHKPGFLPRFLNEHDVDVIISGGMGKKAIQIFKKNNIEVITGASGNVDDVIENYLKGELKSTKDVCEGHGLGNC